MTTKKEPGSYIGKRFLGMVEQVDPFANKTKTNKSDGQLQVTCSINEHPLNLTNAAQLNDVDSIKKMLSGAVGDIGDINQILYKNGRDSNALFMAAILGHLQIVKLLIEAGADVNSVSKHGASPLLVAAQEGFIKTTSTLCSHADIDVNLSDHFNRSPLWFATKKGHSHIKIVKKLLSCPGIDVNKKDHQGISPMDNAKANQDKEMIALLGSHLGFKEMSQIVSTAENVNDDFDGRGCTKLFYMCSVGKIHEVQNLLKIKGVSLQKPNFDGNFYQSCLTIAVIGGYLNVVKELLKHPSVDVNDGGHDQNGDGHPIPSDSPLNEAIKIGNVHILKALIQHPNIAINGGSLTRPLHAAICYNKMECFKALMAHPDIDVNQQDVLGTTALLIAGEFMLNSEINMNEITKMLLEHKDLNVHLTLRTAGPETQAIDKSRKKISSQSELDQFKIRLYASFTGEPDTILKAWKSFAKKKKLTLIQKKLIAGLRRRAQQTECGGCGIQGNKILRQCGNCKCAHYCNRACQIRAFDNGHKSECKKLKRQREKNKMK